MDPWRAEGGLGCMSGCSEGLETGIEDYYEAKVMQDGSL